MTVRVLLLLGLAMLLPLHSALAIDLQPGEIRAPRPGVNLIQVTVQQSERGDLYSHGTRQPGDPEIDTLQYQVRLGRTFEIAEHPGIFYVQTPMGYVHPQGSLDALEGDAGVGDTSMLLAVWPYANHETQTYVAVGAYLTVPTGSYDSKRLFNMGQNRSSTALQVGIQAPVAGRLSWMSALDAVWFQENDGYFPRSRTYEQKALYTAQAGLRYDFSPGYSFGATYFYTAGGETSINGINRNDVTLLNRYQLSAIANYSFGRLTLQYGRDFNTENGYVEDSRWLMRYTRLF